MMNTLLKSILIVIVLFSTIVLNGQNTLPSSVITTPHCNAYFMEDSDITIKVYASDLGGTVLGGSIEKVEFFIDGEKLGETSVETSNTYTYLWTKVAAGSYRITAKATDNDGADFTSAGVLITVGTNQSKSLGLSAGKGKYLANIIKGSVRGDFNKYWNGVTAENSCKWGSVERVRDVMNWSEADVAYNHAKHHHMSFRYHALAWGSQYPSWIKTLSSAEFKEEMEEYIAAVAERYPLIDQIDVLNENMYLNTWNKEEHAEGTPYFREGLGGPGVTGYDWVIWLFEKTRHYFPNAKLVMNDFELVTNSAGRTEILNVIKVLRDRGLIDGFGTQSHYFNVDGLSAGGLNNALNSMARSGVPVYVTELDIKGKVKTEAGQASVYQTLMPVYWNHPAVAGITIWGYVKGATWSDGTGILNSDGSERAAMTWLDTYMAGLPDVGYPFVVKSDSEETTENILVNSEFDNGTSSWQIDNYNGGASSILSVSDAQMSGENALQICVTSPGTEVWHVQLSQNAPFVADKNYEISFMAKADNPCNMVLTMQQAGSPYAQFLEETISLTTENQSFSILFDPTQTEGTNKLKFFVGLNTSCIYLDSIVFGEIITNGVAKNNNDHVFSVYPNPLTSGTLFIENSSGDEAKMIEIFDMKGALLKSMKPKRSKAEVDLSFLKGGLYFVRIHSEKSVVSKKILVQ